MKIGITARFEKNVHNEDRFSFEFQLLQFLRQIFPTSQFRLITPFTEVLHDLQLIIIPGGETPDTNIPRDKFETQILSRSMESGIPILALCRGAQLIAKMNGANLIVLENHINTIREIDNFSNLDSKCFHNFGLMELPEAFEILARDRKDNSIEIYYVPTVRVLGLMSHPERSNSNINLIKKLIHRLLLVEGDYQK